MSRDTVLAVGFGLGAAVAAVLWRTMRGTFDRPLFWRENIRGRQVPVAVGAILPMAMLGAGAPMVLLEVIRQSGLDRPDTRGVPVQPLFLAVAVAAGFGMLGLLDDLAGDATSKGFAGHLRALAEGRVTTGAAKLFGGAAVGVCAAATLDTVEPQRLVVDAALLALGANLANLFDRAPGRLGKVGLLCGLVLVLTAGASRVLLVGPVIALGALAALLPHDLGEKLMLGDTGANALGGLLALGVVFTTTPQTRALVLVVVFLLNVVSERVSFSRVIAATPPLRWLDGLGRRR